MARHKDRHPAGGALLQFKDCSGVCN